MWSIFPLYPLLWFFSRLHTFKLFSSTDWRLWYWLSSESERMGLPVNCEIESKIYVYRSSFLFHDCWGKGLLPCGAMVMKAQWYERRSKKHVRHGQKHKAQSTKERFPNNHLQSSSSGVYSPGVYDKRRKGAMNVFSPLCLSLWICLHP